MFCAPGLIFGGTEGVRPRFHILRAMTRFRRYRGRRVLFSCFALPDSFSAVTSASGPIFMFNAPGLVFGGTEGVGSRLHILRSRTHLRRYRGRAIPFSCFPLPDKFLGVPRASGPFFTFCAPGLIFGGTEGVWSSLHVLRARTHFRRYRGRRVSFHVLHSRTRFWRFRVRRVPFSCFARPDSFSALEGVGSRFYVLLARTRFRRYRGRRVPFSCIALPDSFSAIPMASGPVFMSRSRTRFRRYEGRRDSFFMFCAPGLIFGGTKGVRSSFHIFRSRTCF
jgi:hypothetical protein